MKNLYYLKRNIEYRLFEFYELLTNYREKITYNSLIAAPLKNKLTMKDLPQIFYCNVGNVCWDAYGNIYPIKTGGNWKHINVGGSKVGVSTLPVKVKIFDFDDFMFWYVFGGLCQTAPCPAMGYYVYLKMSGKSISLTNYFKNIENK